MKFGIFLTNQHPIGTDAVRSLGEQLDTARMANDLGLDSLWTGQHYLTSGMTMLQPLPFLARVVPEVPEMTIGVAINLLALHNPVEIAEAYATLDVISGGRLVFGAGLGYRDEEYEAFGLGRTGRVARFESNLAAVRALWHGEPVDIDLPWCQVRSKTLSITPIQTSMPVWIAANSDAAAKRATRLGDAWIINPHATYETVARQMQIVHQEGTEPGGAQPAMREVFCGPTRAEALEMARPYLGQKYEAYHQWGQHKALPGDERFDVPFESLLDDRFVIGSPEDCYEQLRPWLDLGVNHLIFRTQWVGMPHAYACKSLQLLADEVIPALRSVRV